MMEKKIHTPKGLWLLMQRDQSNLSKAYNLNPFTNLKRTNL